MLSLQLRGENTGAVASSECNTPHINGMMQAYFLLCQHHLH